MTPTDRFDVLVLGGGSGGYACALRAAELGMRVAIVEQDKLGGTCLHRGCIPTKALLHAGEVADAAREAQQFGVRATLDGIDLPGVNAYKDGVVNRLHKGLQGLVGSRGVTSIDGTGRLVRPHAVQVGDATYEADHVVLATGSAPRSLPGIAVDGTRVITSDHALGLDELPGSAIVLGGGVIGVEFASAWRSFGVDVTVVEALPRLVPTADPDVSKVLERAFRKRGIGQRTGAPVTVVDATGDGVHVSTESGDPLRADVLLVAVGRGPVSDGLGFDEHGVELDRGFVVTDERLRTRVEGVRAVGDLVSGLQLAHRGFAHGIFVAEDIAGLHPAPVDDVTIPQVTYCEPEVASIGLTEQQATEAYGSDDVQTLTYDLSGNGRSQILRTQGFAKVVRRRGAQVVGIHMVGSRVGELIGEAQLIVGWEATPDDVTPLVHAHPTQNEALGEAHLALAGKPLHVHG